jgi:hypothetical protein
MGFVADVVSGVADAVGSVAGGVMDAVGSVSNALGPVGMIGLGALTGGSSFLGLGSLLGDAAASGVVYDASGMAIDAASVASGATELAGGIAYDAVGNALAGSAMEAAAQVAGQSSGGGLFGNIFGGGGGLGESGGIPTGMGTNVGTLGNLAKVGMNLYSATQVPKGMSPQQAQNAASPYSPYAAQAAQQLNQLVANPASVTSQAGYQAGLSSQQQSLERQLAKTGQSKSGLAGYSAALEGGNYFNQFYNQQFNNLAQLAGATPQNLVAGQSASQLASIQQQNASATQMQYLNAAFGGMFGSGSAGQSGGYW